MPIILALRKLRLEDHEILMETLSQNRKKIDFEFRH
jgi:hypothetical protein